jgi:hypothetical protein
VVTHYYHPLVHWFARRLRFEQESAADSLAAGVFGDRRRYALALAALALRSTPSPATAAGMSLFMSRPLLMRRIAMLRQSTEPHRHLPRWAYVAVLVLVGLAGVVVAGLRSSRATDEGSSSSPPVASAAPLGDVADQNSVRLEAIALIQVSREPPILLDVQLQPATDQAWQVFCKTQLALIKSHFVLASALRKPGIAKLPMLAAANDPLEMLYGRLQIGFFPDTEILYVGMNCSKSEIKDAAKLVDAVVDAYMDEVVTSQRQRRLATRDMLARSLDNLQNEIHRKSEEFMDIAREAGRSEGQRGDVMQQLVVNRIDRIEAELMRLENAQLTAKLEAEESKETTPQQAIQLRFFEQRIQELEKRREELEQQLSSRVERSTEMEARQRDLDQLQQISNQLSVKLEVMDIESQAPDRIQLIQRASPGAN